MGIEYNNVGFGQPIVDLDKLDMLNMMFIGDGGVSDAIRLRLPAEHLMQTNQIDGSFLNLASFRTVEEVLESGDKTFKRSCVSVFARPAIPTLLREFKERYDHAIIADVDDDFHSIPKSHPGYMAVGPGSPRFLEGHIECLKMADLVTTTTVELANRISVPPVGISPAKIRVIPNGWGMSEWWGYKWQRDTVNIGWGGTITHRADFLLCKDALELIAQKHKYVKIVIAGDPEIYRMINKVDEKQKMFLPMVRYEDYPHTLMHYDILLAPLENNRFNNAKSDIKLVDAGASKIPYVASNVPIYQDELWNDGGYLVAGKDEWFDALEELVLYDEIRKTKGEECRRAAESRHMNVLARDWLSVYKEVEQCQERSIIS